MTDDSENVLEIDIVSDVVCPWCIIGYKQQEQAMNQTGTAAVIRWHPFELNPQMGAEGQNVREHVAEKYGSTSEQSDTARTQMTALGKELGFDFNYAPDMKMYNTFRAHQLMHWASGQGLKHQLKMELFSAFFTRNQNVDDVDVLADAAAAVGLDRDEALAGMEDGRYAGAVRDEERQWTSRGIQGVPAVIFNRQHLVSGAQGVENFTAILQQLAQEVEPAST